MKMKTISIKTLGCKLNQYESEKITETFISNGWNLKPFGEEVDIVIINTCTVTDKSDKKCISYIKQGSKFSKTGKLIVTGCLAEIDKNNLITMPQISRVFDNSEKNKIFNHVNDLYNNGSISDPKNRSTTKKKSRASLKIQEGCNGNCSYCIIPTVRGKGRSRKIKDIIYEAENLIDIGYKEIVLTGITIGDYEADGKGLSYLIEELINLKGNFRIRITSIEPNHVTDDILRLYKSDKICNHIHLPLQSGSDKILKLMRRKYNRDQFKNIVERIKTFDENIAIGSDVIIGFPGETEEDFNNSIDIIKFSNFAYTHQFSFSARKGTDAVNMTGKINPALIISRSKELKKIAGEISSNYREKFIGHILSSIIEGSKEKENFTATADNYIKINIPNLDKKITESIIGKLTNIKILKNNKNNCSGELIN
jgi:threonylcarbamoyladenosine tRNA methylthiotransferase MtaB